MMAFFTHCLRRQRLNASGLLLALACVLGLFGAPVNAAAPATPVLKLERMDDGLWLSTQLEFELPRGIEDALNKGIPVDFVARADIVRNRWYWTNLSVRSVQRRMRLSYQPLTGRWRLNVTNGETGDLAQGLSLNQSFESLQEALTSVRRFYRWRIGEAADVSASTQHWVRFKFELDVAQFLRPLQIGTLGQSDWQLVLTAEQEVGAENAK
jgi:hypothetical protein